MGQLPIEEKSNGGGKFTTKDALPFILIGAALLVFSDVFGSKKPVPEAPLPNSGTGIPMGWTADPTAKAMFEAYNGPAMPWNVKAINDATLAFAILDTPDMFAAVTNRFNAAYDDTGNGLADWISNEYYISPGLKSDVLARMAAQGLKGWPTGNKWMNTTIYSDLNCLTNDAAFIGECIVTKR